jgi:aromatic ring-opening dioxygenase catalytic subunit (LigB family)
MPTFFISHGGGPWPHMRDAYGSLYDQLRAALVDIPRQLGERQPRAVLVISAHWEAPEWSVQAHPQPPMLYDYAGFPPHTYALRYAAPGAPALAAQIRQLLQRAGMPASLDTQRGYDHGAFVPLELMYPQARLPVLQLSLRCGLDAGEHLQAGRALATLREQDVLILASGSSYHNMQLRASEAAAPSAAFDDWLQQSLIDVAPRERWRRLANWRQAPGAQLCHPREEHLIPLMVAVGAAEYDTGACNYQQRGMGGGPTVSNFRFG